MASWGLRSLLISTSFEVFLTDQTLPEFNLQTNHITFCCPEYSNNFLHNLVNLTWLHVLLSLVSWRVHLCCQGMQIPGKCKRLGDKSYKNCFKLPPGMWRWGTRGAVPGMTENPGFYQLLPNVIPQIPALQRRTIGRTSWIPETNPKGEKLHSANNPQRSITSLNTLWIQSSSGRFTPSVPFLED